MQTYKLGFAFDSLSPSVVPLSRLFFVSSLTGLSFCLSYRNKSSCKSSDGVFVFRTVTAFHRRIHRRHPAQVWGEQEHHGEPPEQGGVWESRLQTRCGAVSALMMALYVFLRSVLLGAPSPAAHHEDSLEKASFFFCFFFKFILKRLFHEVQTNFTNELCLWVTSPLFSRFFTLKMRIHRKEERLWSVCHFIFTTQHHLSVL